MPLRNQVRQTDPGQLSAAREVAHLATAVAPLTRYPQGSETCPVRRDGSIHRVVEAVPLTDPRQRKRTRDLNSLEGARARYVVALQGVHPVIETQLSDVRRLIDALLGVDSPPDGGPLSAVRTAYLASLRQAYRGFNEQVLDLARACADLFAPSLGLLVAARPPRRHAPRKAGRGQRSVVGRTVRPCGYAQSPQISTSAEQGS